MTESKYSEGTGIAARGFGRVDLDRKRKYSLVDADFLQFLESSGVLDSFVQEDPSLRELLSDMNDLPGVETVIPKAAEQQAVKEQPQLSDYTVPSQLSQPFSTSTFTPTPVYHRAVITAMPLPAPAARSGAAAAGQPADVDDDTNSAATMPMPNKRRRTDDDEVSSSPNDLVEVPSSTVVTTASGTAAAAARGTASSARADTAAGTDQRQPGSTAAAAGAAANAAAAADGAVVKAILVAKVLTKSDSNSKRVILPRIAVEANLPQLAHAQCFNLSATDPSGASWPLVIKAWANGQNPKPVYVLEQVGEMLKQHKLTIGDALALMASEDGRFFLEWNTDAARAAAARPTYSAFTFKQKPIAVPGRGKAAAMAAQAQQQQAAAAAQQQQQVQQQQVEQQPQMQQPRQQPAMKQEVVQQQQVAPQQPQQEVAPVPRSSLLMTAVPVTSGPLVSGAFIPTSPCQLLVMGDANTLPYLRMDDPMQPSLPADMLMLKTRSDAAAELPDPEGLLVPVQPEAGENGALHAGGFLVCPRTAGCTRPAGHQGWCLGHKGYKKRSRV